MDHWLDDLARGMAGGVSRRRAIGRLAALFGGAALATALPVAASADNDGDYDGPCGEFCDHVPRDQRDRCRDEASHGHGLCYDCGPRGHNKGICDRICCPNGGDCLNGKCVDCAAGQSLQCVAVCGSSGTACDSGKTCCAGNCVTTATDANNCGACGSKCPAGQTCSAGKCSGGAGTCTSAAQCPIGQGCCNGTCTALTSTTNCGTCGVACPAGQGCCNGTCIALTSTTNCGTCGVACPAGQGCCNGTCIALTSTTNCGACGNQCVVANGTAACNNGICAVGTCNPGFANCDANAANGCETNTNTDPHNCGTCGNQCSVANGTAICLNGICAVGVCNSGFANCDGAVANGCETNTNTDVHNCGACGVVCSAGQTCCNGACVSVNSTANCGACGVKCATGQTCLGGFCTCAQTTDCPTGQACGTANVCSTTCVPAVGSLCNGGCCSNSICVAACPASQTCNVGVCK